MSRQSIRKLYRSFTIAASIALIGSTDACTKANEALCVERLCFDLSLSTQVRTQGLKHTVLPENAPGWIDLQKYTPPSSHTPTGSAAELSDQLAQRHALAPAVRVLSHGTTTLAGLRREVPVNDLTLQWNGTEYHRRTWLLPGTDTQPWTVIDVTAPSARWAEAEQSLVPLVLNMRAFQGV